MTTDPLATSWCRGEAALVRHLVSEHGARDAQSVISQTGCVGHAHPWLDDDGQCRLSGQVCERLEEAVSTPQR